MPFEIRIGLHTGPVVAGIVGVKKYAYDIWGDTVNLAARMEQNSEAGKINISGSTYELVKEKFTCIPRRKKEKLICFLLRRINSSWKANTNYTFINYTRK